MFMKLQSGKWNLDLTKTKIMGIIKDTEKRNERISYEKSLTLKISHDKSIPEIIVSDSYKLEEAINGLVANAIEKSKEGGQVWIRTRRLSSSEEIILPPSQYREKQKIDQKRPQDTGISSELVSENDAIVVNGRCTLESGKPGMKYNAILIEVEDEGSKFPVDVANIFTTVEARGRGAGLGLAIVNGIVQLMRGCIFVESKGPDKGHIFSIAVPYEDLDRKKEVLSPDLSSRRWKPSPNFDKRKIPRSVLSSLIPPFARLCFAEDDFLSQKLIKRFLKKAGINCIMLGNGKALVQCVNAVLKKDLLPIVFSDVGMPVMDGIEALKEIRKIKTKKKIIVVALTGSPEEIKEDNPGFDYVLGKPIKFDLLREMLDVVFRAVA